MHISISLSIWIQCNILPPTTNLLVYFITLLLFSFTLKFLHLHTRALNLYMKYSFKAVLTYGRNIRLMS